MQMSDIVKALSLLLLLSLHYPEGAQFLITYQWCKLGLPIYSSVKSWVGGPDVTRFLSLTELTVSKTVVLQTEGV